MGFAIAIERQDLTAADLRKTASTEKDESVQGGNRHSAVVTEVRKGPSPALRATPVNVDSLA